MRATDLVNMKYNAYIEAMARLTSSPSALPQLAYMREYDIFFRKCGRPYAIQIISLAL